MSTTNKQKGKAQQGETLKGGVRVSPWKHPRYRWRVSYFSGEGNLRKRFQKGFQTRGEAFSFAKDRQQHLIRHGNYDHEITGQERHAVIAFRNILAKLPENTHSVSLYDLVLEYKKRVGISRCSSTIEDLIGEYLHSLEARRLSKSYIEATRRRIEKFAYDHEGEKVGDITSEDIGKWLYRLEVGDTTINHYRAALLQLFNFATKSNSISSNPVAVLEKIKTKSGEIGILTPKQAARLLIHSSPCIQAVVAIGLFAGLRRSEITKMTWEDIHFEKGFLEVKAKNSKSAARRLVEIRPCLRAWLEPLRQTHGKLMPTEMIYRRRLNDASKAAGIMNWPNNALRHSFASYHLAAFQDASALALEMGHSTTRMIFQHYRALVTPAEALSYWNISPNENGERISEIA
ncbi:tyrosine-type recombinase/integrase [Akkermansiaceae bacterium]|nr:tyrosine-type recombinase/integrase [Akkermansiaceae bacterium]